VPPDRHDPFKLSHRDAAQGEKLEQFADIESLGILRFAQE